MCLLGLPGLIVIPGRLIVVGDATATADHIRAATTWFRIGLASELIYPVVFVFLALALYRLFETVSKPLAMQLVAMVLLSVPLVCFGVVSEMAALVLVSGPSFLSTFTRPQLDSLAYFFLRMRGMGLGVVEIFWGLWLIPFGLLVLRSRFLPRIFGVLLLIAAPGYLLRAASSLFSAPSLDSIASVLTLGELPIIFALLFLGSRPRAVDSQVTPI